MKNLYSKFLSIVFFSVVAVTLFFPKQSVLAQVRLCQPGTGTDTVACVPCTPGPYNICVQETGIIFNDEGEIDRMGYIIITLIMLGGVAFALNGLIIKDKMKR
jgi:hypothetical protein